MDIWLPEKEAQGEEEDWELEGSCDKIHQILTKGNRVGVSSEEVILIYPVLDDEDADEEDGADGEEEAVPADDVAVNDVEGIVLSIGEGWTLEGLIKLNLKHVDRFVISVLSHIEEVGDGVSWKNHLKSNVDGSWNHYQTVYFVDHSINS